jgi:phosphoribosylanthranilate isomerase
MDSKTINIKICGMMEESNIRELVKVHPDYIGFIFYRESKRFIGEDFSSGILDSIPGSISKVGVFVDAGKDYILEKSELFGLKLVQLHGCEPVTACKELFNAGISVIKVFHIDDEFNFDTINPFKPYCKYFLFDTKCSTFGGSSKKFNWDILRKYDNEKPVFLSGGIGNADAGLIKQLDYLNIHAVDINSRFEKEPGIKDISKIKKFIKEFKS